MNEKLVVLKTIEGYKELEAYIKDADYCSYDVETTSAERGAQIIGFSVSADLESGYSMILRYWDVEKQQLIDLPTLEFATPFLELLKKKQLVTQNGIFDCARTIENFNVPLIDSVHSDTMLLAHLLDENRRVGLKELGADLFGESAKEEQTLMKESVERNGGVLKKGLYELYKGDAELIGKYGAKDSLLTLKLFYTLIPELYEQGLDAFFYEEVMPLMRGPSWDLNTTGVKVDQEAMEQLKRFLEAENMELEATIHHEVKERVKDKYPGTKKTNVFNINSGPQRSWLLYQVYGEAFNTLTDAGKEVCDGLGLRPPYTNSDKREFMAVCQSRVGTAYIPEVTDPTTGKVIEKAKMVRDFWNYTSANVESMRVFEHKYKWVKAFMKLTKNEKLLSTYVIGTQDRLRYGVIYSSYLQHGTTSGRFASRGINMQNLPRDDKRVKSCFVARPGKLLIGLDYSQLEPRVFASFSKDERLLKAFDGKSDFYSVIGMDVFQKHDCTPQKEGSPDAFGVKYKKLRDIAKVVALSATYGTTAPKMAKALGKSKEEAQQVIDDYFEQFPSVKKYMLECYETVKNTGQVTNLFGRPRRIPEAREIKRLFPKVPHERLDYTYRNLLNLAVNHPIQSTGASIVNRSAIALHAAVKAKAALDPRWLEVKLVSQVHDSLVLEAPEALATEVGALAQYHMENTVVLPGVKLEAQPKIGKSLGEV